MSSGKSFAEVSWIKGLNGGLIVDWPTCKEQESLIARRYTMAMQNTYTSFYTTLYLELQISPNSHGTAATSCPSRGDDISATS
jgi:hypothetical protein